MFFFNIYAQNKAILIELNGKYSMIYEEKYSSENGTIEIKDKEFIKMMNGQKYEGIIESKNNEFESLFILKTKDSKLEVHIEKESFFESEIIYFRTVDTAIADNKKNNSIIVYSGRLEKIKEF